MCYMPRPSQSSWFDRQYHIWWEVQIIKLLSLHSCRTINEVYERLFNWHYAFKLSKTLKISSMDVWASQMKILHKINA
jgi:hypothetical protein